MTNLQAIDLLKGLEQSLDDYCELNDEGKTAFGMAITALELFGNSEQLPSTQPEPCEDDPRADVYYLAEKIGIHQLYALVVQLRGEPEPCEDAVSRKSVQYLLAYFVNEDKYNDACDGLKHLPPVTPKQRTGKWNKLEQGSWHCLECGTTFGLFQGNDYMNFCPNCGAKMEVTE